MLQAPVPIFRSFSVEMAKEFYVGFLGFAVDWEHTFEPNTPVYMQVSCGACVLHLSEHFGDSSPGGHIRVAVDDVPALCRALNEKQYRHARPGFCHQPWGTTDMTIADPFGNHITFCSPTPPAVAS